MLCTPAEISEMIVLIRNGSKEGFSLLYAKYAGALYGIIVRITGNQVAAQNLLEETFVYIYSRINEYNGDQSFFTWMIQVAQSVCRGYISPDGKALCANAMEMIFFGGYGYDETAKQMNVSAATVMTDIRNKLKSLR